MHTPISQPSSAASLSARYAEVRAATETLCEPLAIEDFVVQSMPDCSPVKWHLAHTTWFFETFLLPAALPGYHSAHAQFALLFNSYYNAVGPQFSRPQRGVLSRPTVAEVFAYRAEVDRALLDWLATGPADELLANELLSIVELGLQHEQQHQELMLMDLKHAFASNPLLPAYRLLPVPAAQVVPPICWVEFEPGVREIGNAGGGFAYDNESPRHRVFLERFALADRLTTCGEVQAFIADGGYQRPELWLSDGWRTVQEQGWRAPLYWQSEGQFKGDPDVSTLSAKPPTHLMTLGGLRSIEPSEPVVHLSFYEADAFARWQGAALPTEAMWEVAGESLADEELASGNFVERGLLHPAPLAQQPARVGLRQMFGDVWEWTRSPYVAYPGYAPAAGALGEYNGKFMGNQLVLRGGACVTPGAHIRATYRNFYSPAARWPFAGLRLCRDLNGTL